MKLPALRCQLAQLMGKVNQVLGDRVADFALVFFVSVGLVGVGRCPVDIFYTA